MVRLLTPLICDVSLCTTSLFVGHKHALCTGQCDLARLLRFLEYNILTNRAFRPDYNKGVGNRHAISGSEPKRV